MPQPVGRVVAVVMCGVLGLAGCTKTTTPPIPSVTPSVSPSSASPTPDLSGTRKDAVDVVIRYRAMIDELRQQYKPDSSKLATVARGSAYDSWTFTMQDDFVNGEHQTGTSSVTIISTAGGPTATDWVVTGCVDYMAVDIVDKNGKSVLTGPRRRDLSKFTVHQDPKNLQWYVLTDEVVGSC